MNSFLPTERRLAVTRRRHPAFPRGPAVLVRLVKHLHKRIHDDANAALKPFGLNHPQYNLLMMLYGTEGHGLSASGLARSSGEKAANITRLTNELCEKGLIERATSEDDRRKLVLSLTPTGLALIDRFLPSICALLEEQTEGLAARDQAELERLLKKFLDGFDRRG
ncbi:MarR family winged helix-turn-helix transcriptional regulator [Frateuria terrea]|uniref:MarR family transcriptional regulator, negative regulator of the multidrug operon emrRAB n=1 Tax=Frateuria terrea TaxID=529704 RepID=A0A1H6SAZ7_9GAMM|nr:MarR family transcriptional regulator [Frateuria terrea]SEI65183.1 MarR family transcriptional regulator, negative regulator of the multidrug operon emrRAB [Frateuria terrea]SFP25120.1 MarR family transcriptional regulator, negative regulator of the multidrug operon emrRAB [Frateuria terrea]